MPNLKPFLPIGGQVAKSPAVHICRASCFYTCASVALYYTTTVPKKETYFYADYYPRCCPDLTSGLNEL
ncbi:MAG TPA: hypothetical protein ENJ95_11220 [Bacteroidetes bacterium]|nr:hypothetical protein [Bacteroidota bacterium]